MMAAADERIFTVGGAITADKDPDETLDYTLDWTERMNATEHIEKSEWIYEGPTELTVAYGLQPFDAHTTTIWLTGGVLGRTYVLVNRITTDEDRILDQTMKVRVAAR
jgi:hypothetical protein